MLKHAKFIACLLIGSAVTWFLVVNYGVSIAEVKGRSMEPTYHDMDKVLVNRWVLNFRQPQRGEIAIIWNPQQDGYDIKRIAGVPGDKVVQVSTGHAYMLGKDQYVVLGDNAEDSFDSRYYGPVHRVQIVGIVK